MRVVSFLGAGVVIAAGFAAAAARVGDGESIGEVGELCCGETGMRIVSFLGSQESAIGGRTSR